MQCEICGKFVVKTKRVRLEGSVVTTCDKCSSYGSVVRIVDTSPKKKPRPNAVKKVQLAVEEFKVEGEYELIEDYNDIIKKSRERLDLKQEGLAMLINEPASLIHRIESAKIEPSLMVGRKLERKLKIKIYRKREELESKPEKKSNKELTLGDVIIVRRDGED